MTNRQANIYLSIKAAFEEVDEMQKHFKAEEINEFIDSMLKQAYCGELTTIKQLAMLYALFRLC